MNLIKIQFESNSQPILTVVNDLQVVNEPDKNTI